MRQVDNIDGWRKQPKSRFGIGQTDRVCNTLDDLLDTGSEDLKESCERELARSLNVEPS